MPYLFADHRSAACKNDFLNPNGYKTLTQQDIERSKKPHNSKPTTAVLPSFESTSIVDQSFTHPVAAVLGVSRTPYAFTTTNTSSILDGDDNDSVDEIDVRAPSKHLFWNCSTMGPALKFPLKLKALIDNGSPTVLIRNNYVTCLGLPRLSLKKLECVELAMSDKGKLS
jgi:hypothetical protein